MAIQRDVLTVAFAELRSHGCTINSEDWTETDTRSKFIDTVLIGCLGWLESDIRRELAKKDDRLDYLLSTTVAAAVVEAKRAKIEFPVSKQKGLRRVKLESLLKACPSLEPHIEQTADYCHRWSAPIAVATNGTTWITFVGARVDRIPWRQGDAIVIPDLFAADVDFGEVYDLLSKESVVQGRTLSVLLGGDAPVELKSVVSQYDAPNATLVNNPIGLKLEPLLNQVFADVTKEDSREVLEHCYVPPSEAAERDEEFHDLLLDKPPAYVRTPANVASANAYQKFQVNLKEHLSRQSWAQTILVIGGVGAGKTFFLKRHFNLIAADDEMRRDTIGLYIDFRKPELDPSRIPEMVWRRLREQIEEYDGKDVTGENGVKYDLTGAEALAVIFRSEVRKFDKIAGKLKESDAPAYEKARFERLISLSNDDRAYVIGACRTLRERYHRHICVILDNADQCEAPYQKAVYLFSKTLESELQCLILVALREEWYWHFGIRPDGPMSAYNNTVYHIPAPPLREVIAKRLEFAIELVEKQLSSISFSVGSILVQADSLARYLRSVQRAFQENHDVAVFHESMANGSVRKGLDIFLDFIRSGHTKVTEYLPAIVNKGDYVLQFHQVFKPVAFGAFRYYRSQRSCVANLVYPVQNSGGWVSYFARAYLLNWLSSRARLNSPVGTGFVGISAVKDFLTALGLEETVVIDLIRESVSQGIIEPDVKMLDALTDWTHLRLTPKGFSIAHRLIGRFAYWEAAMLDTPLNDDVVRNRIAGLYVEGTKPALHQRVLCVKDFLSFMQNAENLEQNRIRSGAMSAACPPIMPAIAELMKPEYDRLAKEE